MNPDRQIGIVILMGIVGAMVGNAYYDIFTGFFPDQTVITPTIASLGPILLILLNKLYFYSDSPESKVAESKELIEDHKRLVADEVFSDDIEGDELENDEIRV